jgi:tetratricopeptide (TPR) repeat protein
MTMRKLPTLSALLIIAWMPPAWSAPQADQKQKDSPDPNESSSQDHKAQQGDSDHPTTDQQTPDQKTADQTPDQAQPDQKPADQKTDDKDSGWSSSSSNSTPAIKTPPQELPKYNPLPAEQDVDVGTYYMHKGDADAAIGRFEDAIQLKADYAKPRMLLAQIYEKKGDKANAVKYYKEYLRVYPHAPDAKKVQAKIAKLTTR